MSEHTAGPWYVGTMPGWGNSTCILRRPESDYSATGVVGDAPIAKVNEGAPHWENKYPVQANARLIAAAPDLLDALKEARRAIGDHFAPNDCYATGPMTGNPIRDLVQCPACSAIAMYDAAILKATGSAA